MHAITPLLRRQKQEDKEFNASLASVVNVDSVLEY